MPNSKKHTRQSFQHKWTSGPTTFIENTLNENSEIFLWITKRNGFQTASEFSNWLSKRKRILDAGCGNGRVTMLLRRYCPFDTQIVGVDYSSHKIAESNFFGIANTTFLYADLLEDMSFLGHFDLIYCQEVLHHTENPMKAFLNLVRRLEPNGEIAIYVYKKKAVLREFSDDFIRDKLRNLSYGEVREVIIQITDFAKAVSKIKGDYIFPEIPILNITKSELSIHRFIYNNLFKNFWNDELTYEENFLVNLDWYHPSTCFRHTTPEVLSWFAEAKLNVIHCFEDDYGITCRGIKP